MSRRRGVTLIAQRKDWDCGVAALAMLLDTPYGDVAAAVRSVVTSPRLKARGLIVREAEDVAAYLGMPLARIYRRRDYLKDRTGMLGLLGERLHPAGHWVVLKSNQILEPDGGSVWDVDAYLAAHKARPCTLLVRTA